MAATNQNIKDFFALTGNNPAVTNQQLTDTSVWLDSVIGGTGSTADDLVDFIYKTIKQQVVSYKRSIAEITF
jgi:hypothetical protein